MVGGTIISVFHYRDRDSLVVRGTGSERSTYLALDLEPSDEPLKIGDTIWWQGDIALWTPHDRSREDVHIKRIGYAYSAEVFYDKVAGELLDSVGLTL